MTTPERARMIGFLLASLSAARGGESSPDPMGEDGSLRAEGAINGFGAPPGDFP